MPHVPGVRWHDGSGSWVSNVGEVAPNGKRRAIYFRDIPKGPKGSPNHRKAKAALDAFLAERVRQERKDEVHDFGDVCQLYLSWLDGRVQRQKAAVNTLRSHRQGLKKFRLATGYGDVPMKGRPVGEITGTEVAMILERWADAGFAPNYIGRILGSVQAVLNWAADPLPGRTPEKLIALNPIAKLSHEATKAPQSPDRYAEEAEVRAFLTWGYARAATYQRVQKSASGKPVIKAGELERRFERLTIDLIRVCYLSGNRPGELRIAEWRDYEPQAVHVARLDQWWGRITLDPTRWKSGSKTGKPRDVFLPPEAVEAIEAIRALPNHHPRFIWTHKRGPRLITHTPDLHDSGEVDAKLARAHGVVWSETALPNKVCELRRLAIAAGVPLQDEGPNRFVMYRLRHTRAAELLMAGVDVGTVARLLGTSVGMIEKTYGSYTSGHLAEAAAKAIPLAAIPTVAEGVQPAAS